MKTLLASFCGGLAVALLLATTSTAQVVLLSDAFERTVGNSNPAVSPFESTWGVNDNADGGTITQTYLTTPTRTSGGGVNQTVQEADGFAGNEGVIRFGAISVDYDFATDADVLAGGGFKVEVDITRFAGGFGSMFFGLDPNLVATTSNGAAFLVVNETTDAAFLMQAEPQEPGSTETPGQRVKFIPFGMDNEENAVTEDIGGFADFPFEVEMDVNAPDGFDAGDTVTYDVNVNGSFVMSQSVVLDGDFGGYLSFSSNSGGALYDNLKITAFEDRMLGLAGDFNGDGTVDAADYTVWRANLGAADESSLNGNGSGSGGVDEADFNLWRTQYGQASGLAAASATVPEPSTVLLIVMGLAATAMGRRNRR